VTPEEVELLSELKIIIPTYNRPLELERAIEYWREFPLKVLILDGSPKTFFQEGQLVNHPGSIEYHSSPKNLSATFEDSYWDRIRYGCNIVNSEYVLIIADDDFATLPGILEALELLKNDNSLDAVLGKCAGFTIYEGKVEWSNLYKDWDDHSLIQSIDLLTRLETPPNKFFVWYGVMRLRKRLEINQSFEKFLPTDSRLGELLVHQLGLAFCRTTMLSRHLWVRTVTDTPSKYLTKSAPIAGSERDQIVKVLASAFEKVDPTISESLRFEIAEKKTDWILNFSESKRRRIDKTRKAGSQDHKLRLLKWCLALWPSFSKRLLLLLATVLRPLGGIGRKIEQLLSDIAEKFEDQNRIEKLLLMSREELRLQANI